MFQRLFRVSQKIQDPISTLGIVDGALYLIGRLIGATSDDRCGLLKYYFVAQPIRRIDPARLGRTSGIEIKRIFPNDPVLNKLSRPTSVLDDRYQQGAACFVATNGDDLVGYIWIILDKYKEDEVRCVYKTLPERKAAWDFDVYINPKYRLGRTFIRLWDTVAAYLAEQQYEASISRISAFNQRSLNSHLSMGAVRLGSAIFVKLGSVQLMFSGLKPYVHVSFGLEHFPTFHLTAPADVLRK